MNVTTVAYVEYCHSRKCQSGKSMSNVISTFIEKSDTC